MSRHWNSSVSVCSIPGDTAGVDLPAAAVHEVAHVDGEAMLQGHRARVSGVGAAHLPPDG